LDRSRFQEPIQDQDMNHKLAHAIAAGVMAAGAVASAPAGAATSLVNFDPPGTPQGPSIYVAVPAMQVIDSTPATFSGGVVLGFATFFPAISFATGPNVYGTADFANGLPEQLSIDIKPGFATTEVSFALFNGEVFNQSYTVRAFDGANQVASQSLLNVAPNFNSGWGVIDITAPNITKITITPDGNPTAYDFLIDTVVFNQSITQVINNPIPPSPIVLPPPPTVTLPPAPPVQGHRHGRHGNETEALEVNFGDDVNDIRGRAIPLVVTPPIVNQVPEPSTWAMMLVGLSAFGFGALRRKK
jgi:hypothetical protein